MIQKPPSKKDIRDALEKDLERFLNKGGDVTQVPKGVSGRDNDQGPLKPDSWHMEKSDTERTQIPNVLKALDERKSVKTSASQTKRNKRPRKKLIYDDFGEPLRWVWENQD